MLAPTHIQVREPYAHLAMKHTCARARAPHTAYLVFRGIWTQFVNAAATVAVAAAVPSEHAPAHNQSARITLTGRIDNNNQLRVAGTEAEAEQCTTHKKRIGNEHGALRLKPSTVCVHTQTASN